MSTRRDFFKQFAGQMAELKQDMMGGEKIPLNRLHELPDEIIEEMEPMFFPQQEIHIVHHISGLIVTSTLDSEIQLTLNEMESDIFNNFGTGKVLKVIASSLSETYSQPFEESFNKVKFLFFRLAVMRICHPREFYDMRVLKNVKNDKNNA